MPFASKAQQGFLFAKHPAVARRFADHTPKGAYKKLPQHVGDKAKKKAAVAPQELINDGPTPVKDKTLKLLGPTDPPTQHVQMADSGSKLEKVTKEAAVGLCCLTLASLTKQACERRDLPQVAAFTKLAENLAATGSLDRALEMVYPDAPWVKRVDLKHALVSKTAALAKDAWVLQDAAKWMEEAPGKAWGAVRGAAGNAWKGFTGAVDRNIVQPMSGITKPIGNFFNKLHGAWNGMQQGWNGAGQPPAPAPAPAAPAVTPPAPTSQFGQPGRFGRKFAESMCTKIDMPKHEATPAKNTLLPAPGSKRKTRYSFNRAPAKR